MGEIHYLRTAQTSTEPPMRVRDWNAIRWQLEMAHRESLRAWEILMDAPDHLRARALLHVDQAHYRLGRILGIDPEPSEPDAA